MQSNLVLLILEKMNLILLTISTQYLYSVKTMLEELVVAIVHEVITELVKALEAVVTLIVAIEVVKKLAEALEAVVILIVSR